ncbi:PREDICTED: uncharacterized protein C7orf43 homolog [Lepidothrix coronata]|uniref:Uncharacterized protein C7orf43 homolog n=1 Tax=Lepidothrix coronata TaxID=321398 RepID=A0A6J0J949_9PASS|nr:PREDICTED: uncharacterized protein C7orf43 homolog [Lepidothrix coronata]
MESQCDYSMYFPAVPFPPREFLAGESGGYRALPRRNHLYLGETVRFLLVLRCRPGNSGNSGNSGSSGNAGNAGNSGNPGNNPPRPPWAELATSLSALATVAPGGGAGDSSGIPRDGDGAGNDEGDGEDPEAPAVFRECRALLTHSKGPPGCPGAGVGDGGNGGNFGNVGNGGIGMEIVVTVWQRDVEPPELQEGGGYLRLLQGRAPAQVFRQHRGAFKAQGGHFVSPEVSPCPLPCPLTCPLSPDRGDSVPLSPDSHHSGEVPVGAFCRVSGAGAGCPCALSALEEHNFLFQLQAPERPPEDAKEGLEVPLVAVVQWSTPKLPFTSSIYTHYRLPSIRLERPRFVMTATCESPVPARRRFTVTYTLRNELQDFLAVRLVWTPDTGGDIWGHPGTLGTIGGGLEVPLVAVVQWSTPKLPFTSSIYTHYRSGSVMERRAITPPVGSPVGRPLYLPPDKSVLALDKIAKRECKVLVVAPVQ